MKIGTCHLWGQDLAAFRAEVRLAASLGYDVISVGDSPAGWHDLYVSLTLAALDAPRARIATMVTSPFIRHPLASTNALCSLDDLSGGRMVLGLSTGGSNVMGIGRMQASQAEIRAEWDAYDDLFAGRPTIVDGRPVAPLRFARKVPIFYSAFGPKALAMAGERADGVILFASASHLDGLQQKIAAVHAAARRAGRDPGDIEIWAISYVAVRATRDAAIDDIKAFLVVNGLALRAPEAMALVPDHLKPAIRELQSRYDPTEHVVPGGPNVALMEELGLTEFLAGFETTIGTADQVAEAMRAMAAMGVSTFIAALPGNADPTAAIRGLAEARDRL